MMVQNFDCPTLWNNLSGCRLNRRDHNVSTMLESKHP